MNAKESTAAGILDYTYSLNYNSGFKIFPLNPFSALAFLMIFYVLTLWAYFGCRIFKIASMVPFSMMMPIYEVIIF